MKRYIYLSILSLATFVASAQHNVPYFEDFSSLEDFNTYTIIDGYNDGCTWELNQGAADLYAWCRYSSDNPKDEWFISPAINLVAGKTYTLSFKSFAYNPDWPEFMEVYLGQGTTAESMVQEVMPKQQISTAANPIYTYTISVDADGAYNIGFHACSKRDMHMLTLDKVSLTEGGIEEKDYSESDIPSPIDRVTLREKNGVLTLTWDAPVTGAHGGKLAPGLKYKVKDNHEMSPITIEATAMEISGYQFNRQTLTYFTVTPVNDEGEGSPTISNYILLGGDNYTLPILDSFDNGPITSIYWNYIGYWHLFGYNGIVPGYEPYDGDGCVYTVPGDEGEQSLFFSGNITLDGSIKPAFDFYYYNQPASANALEVLVSVETGEWERVQYIPMNADAPEGWTLAVADLTPYIDCRYLQVGIRSIAGSDCSPILIDHFQLHDILSKNLAVEALQIPAMATAGAAFHTRTQVHNVGQETAEGYTIQLWRDGVVCQEIVGPAILPGVSTVVDITDVALASEIGRHLYTTRVVWEDDENHNNDMSATERIVIKADTAYPVPQALCADVDNTDACRILLSWEEVPTITSVMQTETFEDYPAFTISEVAPWSVYDADGQTTYYASSSKYPSGYPNSGEAMAWQILNLDYLGFNSGNSFFSTVSGNQILAAFITDNPDCTADDWLLSPQLSGQAHTLSFWASSPVAEVYGCDQFEVLGSTTGRNIEDFTQILAPRQDAPAEWTQISVDVPEGIRYFAIRHTAGDTFLMTIDDVEYSMPAPDFVGYNVYLDGILQNTEPLAEPNCQIEIADSEKPHRFAVTAVYNNAESSLSQILVVDVNAIENIVADSKEHILYDLMGRRVFSLDDRAGLLTDGTQKYILRR